MSEADAGALASPLSLLLEAADRGEEAEEVLLLSYTLDLGFFERAALGIAQALGARVTVVGDAAMVSHDPWAVRRAGRGYVAGLAACSGAFHPKLVVIGGPERVTVAVGSGNLTMAGWQANHELWTVLQGTPEAAPSTLQELAGWLRGLPAAVRFSRGVGAALERVAALLEAFEPTQPGPRLVSSLAGPVIEQLPAGPVDELHVFSPFHDPGASALGRLVERLAPRRLRVGVQPGLSVYDGPALATFAARDGAEVIEVASDRYRHGKLFEASAAGRRWALTGSPNCSAAALLQGLRAGGNCELGLVGDLDRTLMPTGSTLGVEVLGTHPYRPRPASRPAIVVLGATRVEDGLEVVLGRPMTTAGRVDMAGADAPPETWERIADVEVGATTFVVARGVEGGARLRVVGEGGPSEVVSNTVFVLEPSRALRRSHGSGDARRATEPFDLFRDAGLAERFVTDLESLRAGLRPGFRATVSAASSKPSSGGAGRGDSSHGAWEEYLDDCAGRVGHPLLRFALGLPALDSDPAGPMRVEWDEDVVDEDEPGLEADEEDLAQGPAVAPVRARLPDLGGQPNWQRQRYRRWADQLAARAAELGPTERLLALRLVLWTAAAGAWDDTGWMPAVARATQALAVDDEVPSQVEPATGSLAAVALAVMRAHAPRARVTPELRLFQASAMAVAHLVVASDERYVEEYARLLDEAFGPAVHSSVVHEVATEVVADDPVAVAVTALVEELGQTGAHRHGPVLHAPGRAPNPVLAALDAVAVGEEADPVGAWAGDGSAWALVIWREPDLVVFTGPTPRQWIWYRLTGLTTPRVCAHERGVDPRFRVAMGWPGRPMDAAVGELLAAVDLESPDPPDCD